MVDNPFPNFREESVRGYGYCVFGRVVAGMETIDRIKKVRTATVGPYGDVPVKDVVIISIRRK